MVKTLEPNENKKKSFIIIKKLKDEKSTKKQKRTESDSNHSQFSKYSAIEHRPIKNYCIIIYLQIYAVKVQQVLKVWGFG